MNIAVKKEALEKISIVIADIKKEKSKLTSEIEHNIFRIQESEKYLNSITDKEGIDVKYFSPRNVENKYKDQIEDSKNIIETMHALNRDLYKRRNTLDEYLEHLNFVYSAMNDDF